MMDAGGSAAAGASCATDGARSAHVGAGSSVPVTAPPSMDSVAPLETAAAPEVLAVAPERSGITKDVVIAMAAVCALILRENEEPEAAERRVSSGKRQPHTASPVYAKRRRAAVAYSAGSGDADGMSEDEEDVESAKPAGNAHAATSAEFLEEAKQHETRESAAATAAARCPLCGMSFERKGRWGTERAERDEKVQHHLAVCRQRVGVASGVVKRPIERQLEHITRLRECTFVLGATLPVASLLPYTDVHCFCSLAYIIKNLNVSTPFFAVVADIDTPDPGCAAAAIAAQAHTYRRHPSDSLTDTIFNVILKPGVALLRVAAVAHALGAANKAVPGHWQPLDWAWLEGLMRRVGMRVGGPVEGELMAHAVALEFVGKALQAEVGRKSLPPILNGAASYEAAVRSSMRYAIAAWTATEATSATTTSSEHALHSRAARAVVAVASLVNHVLIVCGSIPAYTVAEWCRDAVSPIANADPVGARRLLCMLNAHNGVPKPLPALLLPCLPSHDGESATSRELRSYLLRRSGVADMDTPEELAAAALLMCGLRQSLTVFDAAFRWLSGDVGGQLLADEV
ncbi:hypothetical protein JKP88DRAFT_243988 [Tribonema minus]|uniref:Uncharacterized protein n=1 Tax=Tribonema minus TaxID=303371 RepID=A0A835ZEJ1_9STRA|nr:hypothetical protein JKP88DRAFT_243988 [Tribonema minus]